MEIDITTFVENDDPFEYSASRAERGQNAGQETWNNALDRASEPLLTTDEQLYAFRDRVREFGAWSREEIAGWSARDCNALFIQLVSGDMREAGFDDLESFDWDEYDAREDICHNIYRGDDGRFYYYLGM